jgi:prepilin-type N-terminal cleavage/methylation domain-containing protein
MPQSSRAAGQSGFSLIELIVAMAVTLVVTGAVYGLMSGGNNAFRREPELTDRQQNARVAMDMIQRDIANAGVNMGPFFQSFTRNLNGAGRITGPNIDPVTLAGRVADHLEIFGNDGTCPDSPTVVQDGTAGNPGPTSGSNINFRTGVPSCYNEDAMVLVIYENGLARWGLAHEIHGGSSGNSDTNFPPGQQPAGSQINNITDLKSYNGAPPVAMSPLQLVRYEIAMDPPGSTTLTGGSPALYRSVTGGRDVQTGTYYPPTSAGNVTLGAWQALARGVEDLQVQYRNGTGVWSNDPGAVTCAGTCATPSAAEYNTGVREVRVSMTVRAEGQNLQGQRTGVSAGEGSRANAVRGDVTTVTSVKALQVYLAAKPPTATCPECPVWR